MSWGVSRRLPRRSEEQKSRKPRRLDSSAGNGARATRAFLLLTLLVASYGCGLGDNGKTDTGSMVPTGPSPTLEIMDPWTSLRRPLRLPEVSAGEACPTTPGTTIDPSIGPALGNGPIYPVLFGADGTATLDEEANEDGWYAKKVLWVSDATYSGIALIRIARLDGQAEVRLGGRDEVKLLELQLPEEPWVFGHTPTGWRQWSSLTWFTTPGCYAYQIDGADFTSVLVVEMARPQSTGNP